jgi:hypothetical protein
MPFIEVRHQNEEKHVSYSSLCLSGISLAVRAQCSLAAKWCGRATMIGKAFGKGLSNPVLTSYGGGGVGRYFGLGLPEVERES